MDEHMENFNVESSAIHRKLQSKIEALNIMRKELEHYRTERDQFKLMAETLQLRYSAIKKSLIDANTFDDIVGKGSVTSSSSTSTTTVTDFVNVLREKNLALTTEVEQLREKLQELNGDIELLRSKQNVNNTTNNNNLNNCNKIMKSSVASNIINNNNNHNNTNNNNRHNNNICSEPNEIFEKSYKSDMIAQLEKLKKNNAQLQYDFRSLLDEKEEIVTERDAYKCKVHRLNHELGIALRGDEAQINFIDIDALILENKLLQEKLRNVESELELSQQASSKYKTMLESKRKKGIIKFGTNQSDMIMSHKQAKNLLENGSELPTKAETISDLKSLCLALLDNVNDKNLALSHQKKANKILALRITELEQRLHSIYVGCNGGAVVERGNGGVAVGRDNDDTNCEQNKINGELANVAAVSFSPSEILLNGYCSSTVDKECKAINSNIVENGQNKINEHINDDGHDDDDDGISESLLSDESNQQQLTRISILKLTGEVDDDDDGNGKNSCQIDNIDEDNNNVVDDDGDQNNVDQSNQKLKIIKKSNLLNIQMSDNNFRRQFSSSSNHSHVSSEYNNSSSIQKSDYSSISTTVSNFCAVGSMIRSTGIDDTDTDNNGINHCINSDDNNSGNNNLGTLEIIDYDELPPNVVHIIKQSLKEYKLKNSTNNDIIIP